MTKITTLFDPQLVAEIAKQTMEAGGLEKPEEKKAFIPKVLEVKANQKMFSDLFWAPAYIPDIPVSVYEREDWDKIAQVMIPDRNPHWVWPKQTTELFAMAMYCNDTILLHGLQGTGKSQLPEQWGAKFNIPVWRMSCNEQTREEHFLGSVSVAYHKDHEGRERMTVQQEPSMLTDSMKYGGIFIEDEAFRHSSALVLQALREKNTRKLILPDAPGRSAEERVLRASPERWRYVLTDNTTGSGDTTGLFQAQVQDASTLDRITVAIEVDYLPAEGEKKILHNYNAELEKEVITKMVKFAGMVRSAFKTSALQSTMSVRGLLAWAEKYSITGNLGLSLKLSWFSKLSDDNRAKVSDMYHQVFGEHLGK